MNRIACALALVFLLAACSSTSTKTTAPTSPARAPRTTFGGGTAAHEVADLLSVCEAGARDYSGVPIAAFKDPSDPGEVICWADGQVAKSPPPGPGGAIRPAYNRLQFKVTLDGENLVLIAAGYRSSMPVKSPVGTAP